MALLARARSGLPGAILVTGEPGIGKSTLLAQLGKGLPDALVLHAAGAEHEMGLPLAMLGQLLFPIRRSFALMEEHHRRVLVAAIEHGEPATPTVVGLAVLDLLGALSERHDLTVVILDDVQWMDRLSESALLFAVRRLHGEHVRDIAGSTHRGDGPIRWPRDDRTGRSRRRRLPVRVVGERGGDGRGRSAGSACEWRQSVRAETARRRAQRSSAQWDRPPA